MVSETQEEIQKNLARYLKGEIALHEFEDWFTPVLWDLADSEDDPAREIAGSVHILISEFAEGTLEPEAFRERLSAFVPTVAESRFGVAWHSIPGSCFSMAANHAVASVGF